MWSSYILLMVICGSRGQDYLEWTVDKTVKEYGQNLTLLCHVDDCCVKEPGWDAYGKNGRRGIYLDIRLIKDKPQLKYAASVRDNGFTLTIRNFSKEDVNKGYSCTYGFDTGPVKTLHTEDAFKNDTIRSKDTESSNVGLIVGIVSVVVVVVVVLIVGLIVSLILKRRKSKDGDLGKNKEEGQPFNIPGPNAETLNPNEKNPILKKKEDDQKNALQRELDETKSQLEEVKGELDSKIKEANNLRDQKQNLESQLEEVKGELDSKIKEVNNLRDQKQNLEELLRHRDKERISLHDQIMELKGNIRVFCRVRPIKGDERLQWMQFIDDKQLLLHKKETDVTGKSRNEKITFEFDRVFKTEENQENVFTEISQLVQSALDGYNVCIFAYGQTGSGKTFTMEGSLDDDENQGIIPRAVRQIFKSKRELESNGWKYSVQLSFLEIYNEQIYDLLIDKENDDKLEIKIVENSKELYVPGLRVVKDTNQEMVLGLLQKASERRKVAKTKCNERSSRSHSVFTLKLSGDLNLVKTKDSREGTLNLVDLAGSEALNDDQRKKETVAINKSLNELKTVMTNLVNKDKHIKYRNSQLTYLLQNSLGGNSKTLMFVNVSPEETCFKETLNSLRFAIEVKKCNIGKARQNK